MERSRRQYRPPGKKPQVQNSLGRKEYRPVWGPDWGTVSGYEVKDSCEKGEKIVNIDSIGSLEQEQCSYH